MKKLLCILCCLIAFGAQALEPKVCTGPTAQKIATLKESLKKCNLDFGDTTSNIVMGEIALEQTKCLQGVADEIFDAFYHETKEERHKQFTKYVEVIKEQYQVLESGSDFAKHWHLATVYFLNESANPYYDIYDMVKKYIKYMEEECLELDDDEIEEMKNN